MRTLSAVSGMILVILVFSLLSRSAFTAPPPIERPMEIISATFEEASPDTVDPAFFCDTLQCELLMNCYDTLVFYDGERLDRYMPQLATEWNLKTHNPPLHQADTGLDWYATYTFKIRTGVQFHDPLWGNLTTTDVEFCFERGMVSDRSKWMFYEPLLNGENAEYVNQKNVDPENNLAERVIVGKMIDHAIQSNSTHVWFNLAYPGVYAPFLQILAQQWSSIYSEAWALSLGRPTMWPGTWGDYTGWYDYRYDIYNPATPTLDDPTPVEMGTGPFILDNLNRTNKFWDAHRFTGYWRGWYNATTSTYGVGWPTYGGSKPAGYIDHYKVSWAWDWPTRSAMFLAGDVDYCAVPLQYIGSMLGQPNIRCTGPLLSMGVEALFYNFNIDPTSPYGTVYGYGVLGENGIPRDFFGNSFYGIWMRKAFSSAIDYTGLINTVCLGEAIQPATAIIPGLPQYDGTIQKYTYNLTKTEEYLKKWPGLWNTGFTMQLIYDTGNSTRQTLTEMLRDKLNGMNPKFHVSSVGINDRSYNDAAHNRTLALFQYGWWPDYPDAHDYAYAFYYSYGNYAWFQDYSSASMDALIEQGVATPDGPARNLIYKQIQQRVIDDCPSVALFQPLERHFEQSWICGWYYNPMYSGYYPANQWKWYYIPENSTGNPLSYDVNYDGKTDMKDIGTTAASFGAIFGPPMSAKWIYRCDFNNDRKIDMKDIGGAAKNFCKTSPVWVPSP